MYYNKTTSSKRYKKLSEDKKLIERYSQVITIMLDAQNVNKLRETSWLHYEKLVKRGQSSVRFFNNRVERLIFTETADGLQVNLIEIDQDHYG